jgi:hypothetical protein
MMMRRLDRCSHSAPPQTSIGLKLLVLLLLLLCSPSFSAPGQNGEPLQSIEVGGFLSEADFSSCYGALNASDANGDGEVNATEYVTFAKLLSPEGLLSGVDAFSQLPLQFQAAFFGAACLCQDDTFGGSTNDPNCCKGDNAHIRVPSLPPDEMDLQDRLYMYAVCSYTNSAIDAVETSAPTQSPAAASGPPAAPSPPTVPNQQPSPAPAPTPTITLPATVEYQIAVSNGKTDLTPAVVASYLDDLTQAMDVLAPQVVEESLGAGGRRVLRRQPQQQQQQQQRRRLSVATVDPSQAKVLSNFSTSFALLSSPASFVDSSASSNHSFLLACLLACLLA